MNVQHGPLNIQLELPIQLSHRIALPTFCEATVSFSLLLCKHMSTEACRGSIHAHCSETVVVASRSVARAGAGCAAYIQLVQYMAHNLQALT